MASLNKVFLIGNLTRDPEVRYTPSGAAVGDLGLAISRKFKAQDGSMKDEVCFVNVTVWGRQAETCAEFLKKGRPVMIEGRLKYDEWEKDGKKASKLTVTAERVQAAGAPAVPLRVTMLKTPAVSLRVTMRTFRSKRKLSF
jgi:single-strand DNA-binding protein